tara:strand:- start:256 stop:822 length:567 start_codon:yes stop_codon:yes gene_type:complete
MAYRDPTFNANILTDLLSTYLQQKSNERDRYFKAEQQARRANQPVIRSVGSNLVSVDPVTQQTEVIYQGPQKVTSPKLTKVEDEQGGVTLQPETVGLRTKPPKKKINQKNASFAISEYNRLLKKKNKEYSGMELAMFDILKVKPEVFDPVKDQKKLNFYEKQLRNAGISVFEEQKQKKNFFEEYDGSK